MSVTVFALRRAPVGQDAALLTLGLQGIEEQASVSGQLLPQDRHFYQGVEVPELLVRITDWHSREAYLACRARSRISHQLDGLSTDGSERYFFQPLGLYKRLRYRPEVATCILLETPPGGDAPLLTFLNEVARPAIQALPGLVQRGVYQDLETPWRFLVRLGWASRRDRERARDQVTPAVWELRSALSSRELRFVGQRRPDPLPALR
jgi:hypothetical protein